MRRTLTVVLPCLLLLTACGGRQAMAPVRGVEPAPPEERAASAVAPGSRERQSATGYYVVQRGDTLYSIAWQYGLDYKTLAGWNRIKSPYRIYVGQKLQLAPPATRAATEQPSPTETHPAKPAPAEQKPATQSPAADDDEGMAAGADPAWRWPTQGDLIAGFNAADNKGINIAGREGDDINAAAAGRVVYSGSGLVGLGELVIIKHNGSFLSAYAHNKQRLVKEGELVKSGQTIAHMGRTGTDRVMLHFEVRKDGKPVDPLQYLPRRR